MALYHTVNGSVDYTVVGNPTIVDGVASGFSDSNYITIQSYIPSGNMEAQVSFVYASSSGTQSICTAAGLFSITAINNNLFSYDWTYNNWRSIINGATDNTKYKIKIVRNNDVYTFSVSEDDGSFVEKMSFTSSAAQNTVATLGASYNSTNRAFGGSINLNETYIKANSQAWFGKCPVEVKHINRNSSAVNYVIKDGKLVFADQGLYLTGPVNYTVVGSPTIVDGVASGFSTSNGLTCYSSIASTGNIEFNAKINVQDFSSVNPIFKGEEQYEQLVVRTTGQISCCFGFYDGNWRTEVSTYRISANTTYIVNLKLQDNTCYIKIYDSDNQLLADEQQSFTYQYKATSFVGIGRGADSTYFKGSIDLNNTYIKVNGDLWFYGKNYATQNIAPVPANYTYGTTTTSAIGYVDMRTQVFTAAPSGATIGRDV